MGTTALWGAGGAIGQSIADALRAQDRPYRVVGRSRATLERTYADDPRAEIATWDPADPASVRAAASGVETLVYLVGVDYWRFALHPALMRTTLAGAAAAGVARLLLVGTVYPYGRPQTSPVREDHPRRPHTYKGRMRKEQEDLVLDADRQGRLRGLVLRVPDFYGPGVEKSVLRGLFAPAAAGTTATMLGPLTAPHQYVFAPDVGPVVVRLLDEPAVNGVWHMGAGVTTGQELVARVERELGRPVAVRTAGKTLLRVGGLFDRLSRELVEMNYLMTDPIILDDGALTRLLGPLPKTSYDDGVRATLAALGPPPARPASLPGRTTPAARATR